MNYPDIPDEYANFADAIKATLKESIKIKLSCNSTVTKWQSKVGGTPYLPLEQQYPLNSNGEPLLFLAQLNFSEIPHIEDLPEKGIVEFYIDGNDDLMGLENNGFKVLYFEDIVQNDAELQTSGCNNWTFPIGPFEEDASYSMSFNLENQYISASDYRFNNIMNFEENWEMYDEYSLLFPSNGHRIGGYPFFTQTDPRADSEVLKDYELLFQLDSDKDIMWGDMGVGSFFIKPDDLKELNFSNVFYNWDCT
ncbi:uncharacterized protein YwqG-like [Coccinella septempunctata]|uniref:uncharacterized protein YwqG-like n=1 Tax=Coccinella septempunctata TaxID=41139 RepID=UPI001D087A62|nr:uncharacterized protein YwqG-like [Coccinella septempunctata]